MKVLFDTNVVFDLLLDREPWSKTAAELFSRVESGSVEGHLSATTVTTIYYLATRSVGAKKARREVRKPARRAAFRLRSPEGGMR